MNVLEKEMLKVLEELKAMGMYEIKAEFESEGSRMEEMMRLKDLSAAAGIPIILKIGGVEAVTDIYNALSIGVAGIIAPMAETPYALSKYINIINNVIPGDNAEDIEFAFNLETITAYENLDKMLNVHNLHLVQGVTIGRVDLSGSMGLNRSEINNDDVFKICKDSFTRIKAKGLSTGMGGGISSEGIPFIEKLVDLKLIDKFETRKVVFKPEAIKNGDTAILKAVEFELLWLKSKRRYYSGIKAEDEKRIQMLEVRLNKNK